MTDSLAHHVAIALLGERTRVLAIIAAGNQFAVSEAEIQASILSDVTAEEFARTGEVEFIASQIAAAF